MLSEIGVVDSRDGANGEGTNGEEDARVDVLSVLKQHNIPILTGPALGPTLDLSKKEPPPSPFMPGSPQEIEQATGAEVDDEIDDQESIRRRRRRGLRQLARSRRS